MVSSADPVGSASTSAAARSWNAAGYATTGGQAVWSEATLAQPVKKIVTVARAISRGFQHPAVRIIGPLKVFQPFGRSAGSFSTAPRAEDEEEDGGGEREPGQHPPPCRAKGSPEGGNHRRPRFQSSNRA